MVMDIKFSKNIQVCYPFHCYVWAKKNNFLFGMSLASQESAIPSPFRLFDYVERGLSLTEKAWGKALARDSVNVRNVDMDPLFKLF